VSSGLVPAGGGSELVFGPGGGKLVAEGLVGSQAHCWVLRQSASWASLRWVVEGFLLRGLLVAGGLGVGGL